MPFLTSSQHLLSSSVIAMWRKTRVRRLVWSDWSCYGVTWSLQVLYSTFHHRCTWIQTIPIYRPSRVLFQFCMDELALLVRAAYTCAACPRVRTAAAERCTQTQRLQTFAERIYLNHKIAKFLCGHHCLHVYSKIFRDGNYLLNVTPALGISCRPLVCYPLPVLLQCAQSQERDRVPHRDPIKTWQHSSATFSISLLC